MLAQADVAAPLCLLSSDLVTPKSHFMGGQLSLSCALFVCRSLTPNEHHKSRAVLSAWWSGVACTRPSSVKGSVRGTNCGWPGKPLFSRIRVHWEDLETKSSCAAASGQKGHGCRQVRLSLLGLWLLPFQFWVSGNSLSRSKRKQMRGLLFLFSVQILALRSG